MRPKRTPESFQDERSDQRDPEEASRRAPKAPEAPQRPTKAEKYEKPIVKLKITCKYKKMQGIHLIYSQFRTLEGIGILKVILEANGFAQLKIRKNAAEQWVLDVTDEDMLKPKFALYTGTESAEEKDIILNIFKTTKREKYII